MPVERNGQKGVQTILYQDYQETGGVLLPRKLKVKVDDADLLDAEVTSFQPEKRLAASVFVKP